MKRILVDIIILISAFMFPWWVATVAGIVMLFVFSKYFEIVAIGFVIDTLYNAPVALFGHFQYTLTIVLLLFLIISEELKKRIKYYSEI